MFGPAHRPSLRGASHESSASALAEGFSRYPAGRSAAERLRYLASFATFAPTLDGEAPWRLRLAGNALELREDGGPSRERTLSAGAALHHVRVACEAFGEEASIEELPLDDASVLARIVLERRTTTSDDAQHLLVAAARRRETPFPFRHVLVPGRAVKALANESRRERALLRAIVGDERDALVKEVVPEKEHAALLHGTPLFVTLTTAADTRADWLAAGQSLSAVLLRATELGLAVSRLDGPVADAEARRRFASTLRTERVPQIVLRIGPYDGPTLPAPPRVALGDVFDSADTKPARVPSEPPSSRVLHS